MKVLWVGDAGVSSGFARCTHAACDALHAAGHEVNVLGLNYQGDPDHGKPYQIWPCINLHDKCRDFFGAQRLPKLISRLRPDVVVILNDPWNVPGYINAMKSSLTEVPPVVGWIAVDAKNQKGSELNDLDRVVVWTRFAAEELQRGGCIRDCDVVPLGFDSDNFKPIARSHARSVALPQGFNNDSAFIVGVVGRNQTRKRLDLAVRCFAEWTKAYGVQDAWLYFHIAPTGEAGYDIPALVRYYGVGGRVMTYEPHIGRGAPEMFMSSLYSSFDVLLTTSQGEGWGLPVLEAMACGTPCIVPDWSGLASWVGSAAIKVPCVSTAINAPMNSKAYTIGGVLDVGIATTALNDLYINQVTREKYRARGIRLAARPEFDWQNVGKSMVSILEEVGLGSVESKAV